MIILEKTMPNHSLGRYHKIVKWEMTPESTHAVVNSYASEAMEMISWQDTYTIPLEWKISTIDDIEFIMTAPGAPMAGGTIVPDTVETLMSAQARKWAEAKIVRDKLTNGTLLTTLGPIQIDDKSIVAIASARRTLASSGDTVTWTMADNTARELTLADIETVLCEAARYTVAVHAASQLLRSLIEAEDATVGSVSAIDVDSYPWPSATAMPSAPPPEAPESPSPDDQPENPPEPEDGMEDV